MRVLRGLRLSRGMFVKLHIGEAYRIGTLTCDATPQSNRQGFALLARVFDLANVLPLFFKMDGVRSNSHVAGGWAGGATLECVVGLSFRFSKNGRRMVCVVALRETLELSHGVTNGSHTFKRHNLGLADALYALLFASIFTAGWMNQPSSLTYNLFL